MGMRQWARDHGMKEPVAGTLRLVSVDYYGGTARVTGVVSGPGLEPTPVEHTIDIPSHKLPIVGQDLPVTVDRTDTRRLRVEWQDVPTDKELAFERAEQLAQQMRDGTAPDANPGSDFDALHERILGSLATGRAGDKLAGEITAAMRDAFGPGAQVSGAGFGSGFAGFGNGFDAGAMFAMAGANAGTVPARHTEAASAIVVEVDDIPVPPFAARLQPDLSMADVTLEVTREDGETYRTSARISFSSPERRARVAEVGARVPVRIDPDDPRRLRIDPDDLGFGS